MVHSTLYWRWLQVFGGKKMGEVCFALPYLPACLPLLISISIGKLLDS
jgi:hypothetical protein